MMPRARRPDGPTGRGNPPRSCRPLAVGTRLSCARAIATLLLCAVTATAQDATTDGAEQYATLCARCHGLTGDGRGAEVLDRPARDFTAGGFSFGNTQEAIARTISFGIPGTPMPAFGETLDRDLIDALARHVRTLAPATEEPDEAETILAVRDHPVVVRGGLPPIASDTAAHPRGLLIGLPGGLSFEYRVSDLALLGVRAGEFARRADWTGRGGASLEPLGQVLWLNERGTPRAAAATLADLGNRAWEEDPLVAHLRATRTPASGATVSWDALTRDGTLVAHIDETLRPLNTPFGSGFARTLRVTGPRPMPLVLHHDASPGRPLEMVEMTRGNALVIEREEGGFELSGVRVEARECQEAGSPKGIVVTLPALADALAHRAEPPATITFITLLTSDWDAPEPAELDAALEAELAR